MARGREEDEKSMAGAVGRAELVEQDMALAVADDSEPWLVLAGSRVGWRTRLLAGWLKAAFFFGLTVASIFNPPTQGKHGDASYPMQWSCSCINAAL